MDNLTPFPLAAHMPAPDPLNVPVQDLRKPHRDPLAPEWAPARYIWLRRAVTFLPAVATTASLSAAFADWLSDGGMWWLEWVLVVLVTVTFFWISLSVGTATLGLLRVVWRKHQCLGGQVDPMRIALLVPVFNEDTPEVFGNACAMMLSLSQSDTAHRFELFVLSDTQDPEIAMAEQRAFATLRATLPRAAAVWYRRRPQNTDRKSGNIAQWVETYGAAYQAMVVLDADSLMSADALVCLADEMATDPAAGLIQSSPVLVGSSTLFGRAQQFATVVYGSLLSEGLAGWSGNEGNYWGHNAIIRTAAFAACAGLPRMPSLWGKGGLIMSHDFVEAGLLRRAGWAVRFLPSVSGSYEEPPATLIDYALRDRRWCHGNLQHLRLLATRGMHPVSRFHLFHGAVSYLLSPAWFGLLVIWALLGNGPDSVITYFSDENPLYPVWPEMSHVSSFLILLFMYGMLLAPKVLGAATLGLSGIKIDKLGGWRRFVLSFISEVVISILFAPVMMVQQLVAVLRTAIGIKPIWSPQARKGGNYSLLTTLNFHALETVSGILLITGMLAGVVSLWLIPIAISLAGAVPLSMLSSANLAQWRTTRYLLATPELFSVPDILQLARSQRQVFRATSDQKLAAE